MEVLAAGDALARALRVTEIETLRVPVTQADAVVLPQLLGFPVKLEVMLLLLHAVREGRGEALLEPQTV